MDSVRVYVNISLSLPPLLSCALAAFKFVNAFLALQVGVFLTSVRKLSVDQGQPIESVQLHLKV